MNDDENMSTDGSSSETDIDESAECREIARNCVAIKRAADEASLGSPKKPKSVTDGHLEINLKTIKTQIEFFKKINEIANLKHLILKNSNKSLQLDSKPLHSIGTLRSITLDHCNKNIFEAFSKQTSLEKIEVRNDSWTWNGFPHDVFNQICVNCKKLNHIVLNGLGTGSYFDTEEFPFKIKKLETTTLTYHWYVGINGARVNFLESQRGKLKDLTISQLSNDFDGGKVLKFIFEKMNLRSFYYGKIPLIFDGKKQEIEEFEATEIQITSLYEMTRQFKSIRKITLKISNTDISSDNIQETVTNSDNPFNNVKELIVIDNSGHRRLVRVFLSLFNQFKNLEYLKIVTNEKSLKKIKKHFPITPTIIKNHDKITQCRIQQKVDNEQIRLGNEQPRNEGDDDDREERMEDDTEDNNDDGNEDGDDGDGNHEDDEPEQSASLSNQGTIELKNGPYAATSRMEIYSFDNVQKVYIQPFGYPYFLLRSRNKREFISLVKNEVFSGSIVSITIEEGKLVIVFTDLQNNNSNQLKIKLQDLAFSPFSSIDQFPLIPFPGNLRIKVSCEVDFIIQWNNFVTHVPSKNNLSTSLWKEKEETINEFSRTKTIVFNIDAFSWLKLKSLGFSINYKETQYIVTVIRNPLEPDMTVN